MADVLDALHRNGDDPVKTYVLWPHVLDDVVVLFDQEALQAAVQDLPLGYVIAHEQAAALADELGEFRQHDLRVLAILLALHLSVEIRHLAPRLCCNAPPTPRT